MVDPTLEALCNQANEENRVAKAYFVWSRTILLAGIISGLGCPVLYVLKSNTLPIFAVAAVTFVCLGEYFAKIARQRASTFLALAKQIQDRVLQITKEK